MPKKLPLNNSARREAYSARTHCHARPESLAYEATNIGPPRLRARKRPQLKRMGWVVIGEEREDIFQGYERGSRSSM